MRLKLASESKYTPTQLSECMADSIKAELEHLLRLAEAGRPIDAAIKDFSDALCAQIVRHRSQIIISPLDGVSDEEWAEAYEEAALWNFEALAEDREPTQAEVESALESIEERRGA